ncbi:hypothetical protein B0T26DRAFT_842718 [Lasiosphaeria miniovina]|uniref:Checkpoint serine/threonine-protein kinase bub1 n=1 Tax=Lasiosphaeria miniovina TaxID=1954250 RepID=A0AA40EDI5_9PEZI|nr:uncharacterized protein B0T26DRAFT_842718 [Lasiosphaeria miniovina]KAK0733461.1 hypothetical protein B0T26DRAFT_842718 [Lasiosphaeria miniovina]
MASDDLIDFDIIEGQKENIQALPSGRSAKKLAELFSANPLQKQLTPTPSHTKTVNDSIREEFEAEITALAESDDPLDVYDRYVRWTLDAYPSAQATPQSQLHTVLERATKAFINAPQYKNDPRYLKLWLHYIQLFSDAPRETFVFLSRHSIGETLALFYEEYAAWLEAAGRWAQAEEVYKMGIEREARPTSRLLRKFGEFEQRRAQLPDADADGPSSPALPTVRPALAAKIDPFAAAAAAAAAARDPQAPRPNNGIGGPAAKPGRTKLAIFSDADAAAAPSALPVRPAGSKGWESIGSLADRKKENVMEAKSWAGETLKAGGKKSAAPKMAIFKDTSQSQSQLQPQAQSQAQSPQVSQSHIAIHHSKVQVTVNPTTGKRERIFVDLRSVYPTPDVPGTELSFEEVWAANRGWLDYRWEDEPSLAATPREDENRLPDVIVREEEVTEKLVVLHDVVRLDENGAPIYPRESKPKKKKVVEVNETQIIKAKLDSPSGPKMRKKHLSAEPTMTLHTRAATDDIYEIFNAPLKPAGLEEGSDDENGYETDDYTSGAESTGTTTRNISTSEAGDVDEDEAPEEAPDDETSDVKSVSEWSDFSTRKHIPGLDLDEGVEAARDDQHDDTQLSDLIDIHQNHDGSSFGEPAGSSRHWRQLSENSEEGDRMVTPVTDNFPGELRGTSTSSTVFVPIPPEDYVPSRRTYRDPVEMANNRLPFMTPITERTESSLDITSDQSRHALHAKTPSKRDAAGREVILVEDHDEDEESSDLEPLSSPLRGVMDSDDNEELSDNSDDKAVAAVAAAMTPALVPEVKKASAAAWPTPLPAEAALIPTQPIIQDLQCNPVDDSVRAEILAKMQPPLGAYEGFYDHRGERFARGAEIRKFAKALMSRSKRRSSSSDNNKTATLGGAPIVLHFPETPGVEYTVRRELGKGAFAPVYLVENSCPTVKGDGDDDAEADLMDFSEPQDANNNKTLVTTATAAGTQQRYRRREREALKMEDPPSAWEFYMMRLAHARLGSSERATASLSPALALHLYQDEGFLFLPFHAHGTLLDVVNLFRGEASGVMDEALAMFFAVELLRTVEALHARQLLHGDVKADNCLLRLDSFGSVTSAWRADGAGGWAARGLTLIDFGRAIDMAAFKPDVQFVADWKTTAQDCAEMRDGRPWTWQIDYHGLAGTIHCLLFGKYIETVPTAVGSGGVGSNARRYKIRESLKRYWQTDIWGDCFDLLLNPVAHVSAYAGGGGGGGVRVMPVLHGMRAVRRRMEHWLEANSERGVGLRSLMAKVEAWARGGRR